MNKKFLFQGISIETGETVQGSLVESNGFLYIIQSDCIDTEDIDLGGCFIKVVPNSVKQVNLTPASESLDLTYDDIRDLQWFYKDNGSLEESSVWIEKKGLIEQQYPELFVANRHYQESKKILDIIVERLP